MSIYKRWELKDGTLLFISENEENISVRAVKEQNVLQTFLSKTTPHEVIDGCVSMVKVLNQDTAKELKKVLQSIQNISLCCDHLELNVSYPTFQKLYAS
jgi:dihydroorotate dehydrogenase